MSQAVLDGVRDLLPTFRERAEEAERLRVVPEANIKELEETGFFRLLQPKRFDGLESDPIDFYTAVRDIASACGSTGWVSSVVGVHPWQVALFADEAQQAVWGEDTSTRLSSSYAPTGKARSTEGGYTPVRQVELLAPAATTARGCCSAASSSTPTATSSTSRPSWSRARTTRSSTSGTWSACAAPAPTTSWSRTSSCPRRSRCRWARPASAAARARSRTPPTSTSCRSTRSSPAPSPRRSSAWPWARTPSTSRCSRSARRAAYLGEKASLDPFAAVRIAKALARSTPPGRCWSTTSARSRHQSPRASRSRSGCGSRSAATRCSARQRAIDAIDSLFEASGGRALAEGTYLQRAWRDAHAGRVHAANDPERALQMFGAHEFGHKIDPGMY